jgi:hypothetical protein
MKSFQIATLFIALLFAIAHAIPNKISATRIFAQNNQVSHVSEHKWPQMANGDSGKVPLKSHNLQDARVPKPDDKEERIKSLRNKTSAQRMLPQNNQAAYASEHAWPQTAHGDGWSVTGKSFGFAHGRAPKPEVKHDEAKSPKPEVKHDEAKSPKPEVKHDEGREKKKE